MNKYSLIYRNIYIYRTIMIILYSGKYLNRFKSVTDVLSEKQCGSVTELCFGDIYLAQWCKNNGVRWTGIDVNEQFVSFAIKQGYDAKCLDLLDFPDLQKSSVIVMMGSLYHFNNILPELIDYVMKLCDKFIISEPIKNLSNSQSLVGWIAKRSANSGNGNELFRFTKDTLMGRLDNISGDRFIVKSRGVFGKDIVLELIWK
jgi:hypothetical protein